MNKIDKVIKYKIKLVLNYNYDYFKYIPYIKLDMGV